MSIPIVSVVMSVLNGERFLREAVESILDQSFREFEFIVINDGSTDSSGSILDSYQRKDPRVRVIHQENKGMGESWNRGCGLARGKYLARIDPDDVAVQDRLMWQVDFMDTHPQVGVVGGAVEVIDTAGRSLRVSSNPIEDHNIRSALLQRNPFSHPTVLMRRDIFAAVGGYRKAFGPSEDYDLWLRLAERCQLANLEAVLLKYRLHPSQITVRNFRQGALSVVAAQTAATLRRDGKPDPFDAVVEITPAVLVGMGVSEATQQIKVARRYVWSISAMYETGEYAVALSILRDMFGSSDWKHAERCVITDTLLFAARLHWRQRRIAESVLTAGQAVITRPFVLGRPLKRFVRWLWSWRNRRPAAPV
jgi:glycosyltransferase involved in cell wall biosynthesis